MSRVRPPFPAPKQVNRREGPQDAAPSFSRTWRQFSGDPDSRRSTSFDVDSRTELGQRIGQGFAGSGWTPRDGRFRPPLSPFGSYSGRLAGLTWGSKAGQIGWFGTEAEVTREIQEIPL